ncbi:MAG: M48 family metallopeptidase [Verrucomicrobiia bacterium]
MNLILLIVVCLILLKATMELVLLELNRLHTLKAAQNCPEHIADLIDRDSLKKSISYTLWKIKFNRIETIVDAFIIIAIFASGLIPKTFDIFLKFFSETALTMGLYLFSIGFTVHLLKLPLDWYWQFKIEDRFGFNTTTLKIWISDQIKLFIISLILTVIITGAIYYLYIHYTVRWALLTFIFIITFQILLTILAPKIILPLFNKLSPLPEGQLKEKLLNLCRKASFPISSIEIMDGSKRSKHSNAFFTGFGKFRKIVLFDTLIQQLSEDELLAVTSHEIGHYKHRHIIKSFLLSAITVGIGIYIVDLLIKTDWFYTAFGLSHQNPILVLLILFLIGESVTFWLAPLFNIISRRWEYQADAFAVRNCEKKEFLISALKKLTEKNLSNLFPHPLYSAFYYSHPNLIERIKNIERCG